jgi:hypothetical protein
MALPVRADRAVLTPDRIKQPLAFVVNPIATVEPFVFAAATKGAFSMTEITLLPCGVPLPPSAPGSRR